MSTRNAIKGAIDSEWEVLKDELLTGAPDFFDLPDEHREKLERNVQRLERLYWMQVRRVEKTPVTQLLIRRAIYAEQRAHEAESRLGEMALIVQGAEQKIEELETQLTNTAKGIKGA